MVRRAKAPLPTSRGNFVCPWSALRLGSPAHSRYGRPVADGARTTLTLAYVLGSARFAERARDLPRNQNQKNNLAEGGQFRTAGSPTSARNVSTGSVRSRGSTGAHRYEPPLTTLLLRQVDRHLLELARELHRVTEPSRFSHRGSGRARPIDTESRDLVRRSNGGGVAAGYCESLLERSLGPRWVTNSPRLRSLPTSRRP